MTEALTPDPRGLEDARRAIKYSTPPTLAVAQFALAEHARAERLAELDREAATHVETLICMRTAFTGEPPYVGWKGLGKALTEALDERDTLADQVRRMRGALEEIDARYEDPNISHKDFRIATKLAVAAALLESAKQEGE